MFLMKITKMPVLAGLCVVMALCAPAAAQETAGEGALAPRHGVAMHGAPKYGPDFTHLDYVNPDAPKGGTLRLASRGNFDNLNPYILKGETAPGISLTFQTLMVNTDDEAFSEYGLIAETVEMPEDRSFVVFNLRAQAKFHDGRPITAQDVVWTFNTLMEKGHPFYKAYYANVKDVTAENDRRVKFTFNMTGNLELPLIIGQMPVLAKHDWEGRDFASTTLKAPLGSGPYKVKSVDPGRRIVFERVKDWWAKDLPIMKGQYNFDTITYDLYLDDNVLLQALFAGQYDVRQENIARAWANEYKHPAVAQGRIVKEEIEHDIPTGLQGFVFNTRRDIFADAKTREALNYAFDFEWSNRQVAYGAYKRTQSYFENSELRSSGLPQGRELEILAPFRGKVPEEVFTAEYKNPATSGSGQDMRANLRRARELLEEAGWTSGKNGMLERNGKPFTFEIIYFSDTFEPWINPFISNLKKIGVQARLRIVDTAQYQNRMDGFDFDMTVGSFGQSLSPGNEQRDFWSSEKADVKGSRNLMGIKDPVVDALIDQIIAAKGREDLIAATRALDRVLLWGHYVIPQWYLDRHRIAHWDKFGRPAVSPRYGVGIVDTWWYDAGKAAKAEPVAAPKEKAQ